MNIHFNKPSFKTISAGGIAVGVLTTSSAHAQLVVQTPNATVSDGDVIYFNVEPPSTFSGTYTNQELELNSSGPKLYTYSIFDMSPQLQATGLVSEGTVIGPDTMFSTDFPLGDYLNNGVNYVGFEDDIEGGTSENYGYLTITQSEDDSGTAPVFTDTVNTIALDTKAGQSVTVGATPEPSTTGLFAAAAAGAGALALYRRNRRGAAIQ